jgi:CRISPR-associated protein Cmr5
VTQQQSRKPRRQTIEQERGKEAWDCVKDIKKLEKKEQQEYRSLARGLNAMIQVNGLGQTLGFLKAKGKAKDDKGHPKKNAHYFLLEHLTHWMHHHFDTAIGDVSDTRNDGLLIWALNQASTSDYRRATTECLAFGRWLSRFAEAELSDNTSKVDDASKGAGNG